MNTDKILKLLKSGIWEDALIAFTLMKDWTLTTAIKELALVPYSDYYLIDIKNSTHILCVQINSKLYAWSGGIYSLNFGHRSPNNLKFIVV